MRLSWRLQIAVVQMSIRFAERMFLRKKRGEMWIFSPKVLTCCKISVILQTFRTERSAVSVCAVVCRRGDSYMIH